MLTWTERATLFKILAVLWTQHRWCLVLGKTSSIAFQKPSAPSPTARSGAEEFTPALCAFADSDLEADEFLLAFGCCTDQHQHGFGIVFHPGLQVDPVSPNIHVLSCREIPLLPGVIIRLPLRRQPRDYGRRQVWRVLAQQGGEPLLEITGRHPA